MAKITLSTLKKYKKEGHPFAVLTCYDYATAVLLQKAQIDSLLVGDTLSQMILGHQTTLHADMEIMITLTAAVRRGAPDVYLIGDMPFLSYQVSRESAMTNAGRFITEAGCDAVKLEVDRRHIDLVAALSAAGIPVIAHLGIRPQSVYQLDGFRSQGVTAEEGLRIIRDSREMISAGICGILLECVTTEVAREVCRLTDLPIISCGSGRFCDGQVMVLHDMLGLPGAGTARFAKTYAQIGEQITQTVRSYVEEIHDKKFPDENHSYHMNADEKEVFDKKIRASRESFDRKT